MRQTNMLVMLLFVGITVSAQVAKTDIKSFPNEYRAGAVSLLASRGEYDGRTSAKVFTIAVSSQQKFYIDALANLKRGKDYAVYIDKDYAGVINVARNGWQYVEFDKIVNLTSGKHEIKFLGIDNMTPMFEELYLSAYTGRMAMPEKVQAFLQKVEHTNKPLKILPVKCYLTRKVFTIT